MSRIIITSDADTITIRQGASVVVIGKNQAQSVAANLLEHCGSSERHAVLEFDSAVRGFYAVGGSRHSSRLIGCDGQDETETRSDGRQRLREAGLDGTDSTGG